mgnify:CR=1 FL=1
MVAIWVNQSVYSFSATKPTSVTLSCNEDLPLVSIEDESNVEEEFLVARVGSDLCGSRYLYLSLEMLHSLV